MSGRFAARLASREAGLLGLILAGALGVRLLGVGRGLPYLHEWDEPTILSQVIGMLQRGDLNPHEFIYPHVYFYMLLPVMYLHYAYLHAHGVLSSPLDIQLSQPLEPYWYLHPASFYLWGRALTSLVGTATVFLVYRIGKTAYGRAAGLLAAALLALAPGAVYYSDTVRVDIPMTFFVTLTVLAGLGIIRHGRWQNYILAGFLAGLAISTKQNAIVVVLALLVAHLVRTRRVRAAALRLPAMGFCVLVGVVAGTPSLLSALQSFIEQGVRAQVAAFGGVPGLLSMQRTLPGYLSYFVRPSQGQEWFVVPHTAMGRLPVISAIGGMVAGFRGDRRLHLYLLSFPLLYFLVMSGQREFTLRTMMPVLPFAALFAGVGCVQAWQWVQTRWPARGAWVRVPAATFALVVLLAVPGRDAVSLGWTLGHQPDTRTAAVEWLRRHVAPGARIAFEGDLRWHTPDLYRLPFALRFAPQDANADWYLEQHVDFAVVGDRSPLRSLPAVAAFPRPAYMGPEAKYPIIDPGLYIVRPRTAEFNAAFPVAVEPGQMILEPGVTTAAGVFAETAYLPDQHFPPGSFTISLRGNWPRPGSVAADRLTGTVVVGRRTVGTVTADGIQPLRFTTPPFQIVRPQTLPVRVDLVSRIQQRPPDRAWALRPSATGCATAPDAANLDPRQLTVEAWVYLADMNELPGMRARGAAFEAPILSKRNHEGYSLKLTADPAGRIFADFSVAGKFSAGLAPFVPLRTWTHIAATYDGHEARIYLGGAPAPPSRDPRHEGTVHAEGAPLVIGCREPGTPNQTVFNGLITGVRIWNRVLPLDAIRDEAGLRPLPGATEGLVGSWSFRSVVDGTVPDLSGAGNDLTAQTIQRVPIERGPLARPRWNPQTLLLAVKIARVSFPVTVEAADMTPEPAVSNVAGVSSETVRLPDQAFPPGSYTLTVIEGWPRPGASAADRLTAKVVVDQRTVGTVTVTGARPLRFTTPPFRIDQTQTLPVRVDLTFGTEPQALRPAANGCAIAPDAPTLNLQRLTVETWVYLEGMNEPPQMHRFRLESEGPILGKRKHEGYYLRLVGEAAGRIYADLSVAGKFSVGRAGFVPLRKWTHIAATYDGHEARVYLNGIQAPPERNPRHEGTVHAEDAPLVVGCRDPGTPYQLAFKGLITGVRIWDKVLPPDAIRDEAGRRPLPDATEGLAGSWSFQALVRGMVPDQSGAGNNLIANSLQRIPGTIGPPVRPAWTSGRGLLRAVKLNQLGTFPVTVHAGDMLPEAVASDAAGVTSAIMHLPDHPFVPGSYTLAVTGGWPRPGAEAAERLRARVVVGRRTVGMVTVTGTQPLRFTTPPFRIDQTQILPVQVELTSWTEQQALHPPADGCAIAPNAPKLDVQQLTAEAWVYLEEMNEPPPGMRAAGSESEAPILGKRAPEGYYLRIVRDANGKILADLSVAGKFSVGRAGFVPRRKWTHIAATYDGHEARIYLNGVPAPPERNPRHEGTVRAQSAPFVIGCRDPGTFDQLVFIGFLSRVRVWNKVLPPEAIREEAGLRPLPDIKAGLTGSWSFQSLVRGMVPDQSGGGNNLAVDSLQPVPIEIGRPAGPARTLGQVNVLRTVTIERAASR